MRPASAPVASALLALIVAGGGAFAQKPPPDRPGTVPAIGTDAPRPPERPQEPLPETQGRLIPPEDMPPLPTDEAQPDEAAPATQGRLIPPEEMPPIGRLAEPPAPMGPPAPELLRESDFALAACKLQLTLMGARYADAAPITDPEQRDCGIARPIRVTEILPGVALEGGAEMRCDTARALAFWTRGFVQPAAARLPGAPRLAGLMLGTGYHCRLVVGDGDGANLSEHATGSAVDIMGFTFADADPFVITPRIGDGDLAEAFQATVQAAACMTFTTVLGPGSNAAHDDHLHLDIKQRGSGYRLCQ